MATNVVLATATLGAGNGGIARVARLMARILAEEMAAGSLQARALVFLDSSVPGAPIPTRTARGGKVRFAWEVHKAALSADHFLYDHLGVARAHPRVPLLRCPYLAWMCGVEIWGPTSAARVPCARRADTLVAISDFTRTQADRLHGGFAAVPICWLGTDTDEPAAPPKREGRPTVMILARMDERGYKGHRELIDCWPRVVAAVPGARLLVAGKGPALEEFRQLAASSSAAEHIAFLGFVPEEQMDRLWAETSVFAMPSRREGFGLVYIEAMRQRVPVVASVHDAAPEVNLEGVTGYNVNLDKSDELPERLIHLLKNPDHAAELGLNGERRWLDHFTYNAFKRRFLPILTTFLGH
jgi:phosphatidylinositol alpha-1,6-mannosyltransferase